MRSGVRSERRLHREEKRILTWSDDGTARLWDAATGQELGPLRMRAAGCGLGRHVQPATRTAS